MAVSSSLGYAENIQNNVVMLNRSEVAGLQNVSHEIHSPMKTILTTEQFIRWLDHLKDLRARARIQTRIQRLALGNSGDCRYLRNGVSELKIDTGPGYRVYFTERENTLIILLCGGDKSSQGDDILLACELAKDSERNHDH